MPQVQSLEPSWFLNTPTEVKSEVVNYLDRKRDLYNLSQACHHLEEMVTARLYRIVDLEIPQKKGSEWILADVPRFRPRVIASMQAFYVRDGPLDTSHPVYSRRRKSDAGSVDAYVCDIVDRIPANQLRCFAYLHNASMSVRMLKALRYRHSKSLQELSVYELDSFESVGLCPEHLRKFECRSVLDGELVTNLVRTNRLTLEQLTLAQEKELLKQYRASRNGVLHRLQQPGAFFTSFLSIMDLPKLRELKLCGLNVAGLISSDVLMAALFCKLESLSLESCALTAEFLESLASTYNFYQHSPTAPLPRLSPRLKSFTLRHEAPTNRLKDALLSFLSSFSGLHAMSILIENGTFFERPATLISAHGPTLQHLVLECRIQPRVNLAMDTSRPFGYGGYRSDLWHEAVNDIYGLCPNLTELGVGFPWNDEMVRLQATSLPKSLRTIHIRNFPESKTLRQLGEYSIKEYATKFVEWVYPSVKGGAQPRLEEVAIGPTLYPHRWKTDTSGQSDIPQFLCTHYFCVDWVQTRLGRWGAVLSAVSEKYMEEARGEKPLAGVFEPVWLT